MSSSSDHGPFAFRAGVPVANVRFARADLNLTSYPTQHTRHDSLAVYRDLVDPGFRYLQLCARVLAHAVRKLADEPVLPHDVVAYADAMLEAVDRLRLDDELQVRALFAFPYLYLFIF